MEPALCGIPCRQSLTVISVTVSDTVTCTAPNQRGTEGGVGEHQRLHVFSTFIFHILTRVIQCWSITCYRWQPTVWSDHVVFVFIPWNVGCLRQRCRLLMCLSSSLYPMVYVISYFSCRLQETCVCIGEGDGVGTDGMSQMSGLSGRSR